MVIRSLALAVLAAVAVAAPAAAAPKVTGVAAYLRKTEDSTATVLVFRTDAALPFKVAGFPTTSVRIDGGQASTEDVSPSLRCYQAQVYGGHVGQHVRVRVGRKGSMLDRVVSVQRLTPGIARGGTLGCGADPVSSAVIFNMYPPPLVQPGRFFFTANSGPYLKDLVWTGWGTPVATATGTYVSDCASCGAPQKYAVTVTVDGLADCPAVGAKYYTRLSFERAGGRLPRDPSAADRMLDLESTFFC
jgi:hypothetical protein